jgi:nucleotide-binding universal stress UspA family protein
MFRRIVCATDFSEQSAIAARYAASIARASHGSLELVHAWTFPVLADFSSNPNEPIEMSRRAAAQALTAAVAALGPDLSVTGTMIEGAPERAIVAYAAERGADLLVTGSSARKGIAHALLGSITERILRLSTVPVLAVPVGTVVAPDARFAPKHILVPVDLEAGSAEALRVAIAVGARSQARIAAVYAWQSSPYAAHSVEISMKNEASERALLDAWMHRALAGAHTHVEHIVREGEVTDVIVEVAAEQHADMLVMATAGRVGLAHFMLGSVTERTLRTVGLPVLTHRMAMAANPALEATPALAR